MIISAVSCFRTATFSWLWPGDGRVCKSHCLSGGSFVRLMAAAGWISVPRSPCEPAASRSVFCQPCLPVSYLDIWPLPQCTSRAVWPISTNRGLSMSIQARSARAMNRSCLNCSQSLLLFVCLFVVTLRTSVVIMLCYASFHLGVCWSVSTYQFTTRTWRIVSFRFVSYLFTLPIHIHIYIHLYTTGSRHVLLHVRVWLSISLYDDSLTVSGTTFPLPWNDISFPFHLIFDKEVPSPKRTNTVKTHISHTYRYTCIYIYINTYT